MIKRDRKVYACKSLCLVPLFKCKRRREEEREKRKEKKSEENRESVRLLSPLPPSALYLTFRTPIPELLAPTGGA
jgi:hypothetical protein